MDRLKAIKILGTETVEEMEAMSAEALGNAIIQAVTAMAVAQQELEANPQYIELKANMEACTQARNELNARQKARIAFSLELLEAKGK